MNLETEKIRVYEIAKKLKLSSKEVIDLLDKKMQIKVKSHASILAKDEAEKFFNILKKISPEQENLPEQTKLTEPKSETLPQKIPENKEFPNNINPKICIFNFQYIKNSAAPGSWRRGYEYYQTNQVLEISLEDNIVKAFVKGKCQDKYSIELIFSPEKISAKCDCPLSEEWCKHAVAVGLVSINKHFYETYLTNATGQKFKFEDENPSEIIDPQGGYKFILNTQLRPKNVSIQIIDRCKNEKITDIESILRAVMALQSANNENFILNNAQKAELALMQSIYKAGRLDKISGWHDIPLIKVDEILKILAQVEEVIDYETNKRLEFKKDAWQLILSVNVSLVGNVLLSLHWKRFDPKDIFPMEEIKYFSRHIKWGRYKNIIFPLDTALVVLPHYLTRSSFTDIRDADGGKFVYEELPKHKNLMTVEISETLEKLTLEQKLPVNVLYLELTEDKTIKASLNFEYDGTLVPYGKLAEKTPYVTVKKPKEELIYWIKRNIKQEEKAYKTLLANKFTPMPTNNLLIELDGAIDFYNLCLTQLKENWKIEEINKLSSLKSSSNPLKIHANIDFDKESTDSFNLEISCAVGETLIDLDTVQSYLQQGKKYFYLENEGYVEVPLAEILQFTRSLNNFDAQKIQDRKFQIKTFRAGLINELIEQQVILEMSKKFKEFWDQISTFNTLEEVELPKNIKAELREYQKKGFNWLWFLYSYGLNGILADDMGLGKTLQTLILIQKAKEKNGMQPALVICPTSVVFNWEDEIDKFAPELSYLNLTGSARKDLFDKIKSKDVIITSYALIRRDINELKKHSFRFVVLDESQNIKNQESLTAQCSKQLITQHRLALSGTPVENKLSELWSVFDFLMPGFLYDLDEFNYKYTVPIVDRADRTAESRLKKQIYPFILRRMKRDIAKDLPDKIENIAYCHLTPEQRDFYLEVLDSTRNEIFQRIANEGIEKSKISIFAALLRLRQICNHPKLYDKEGKKQINESGKFEHLKEMLEEIISEGHRILLFSQFVQMLNIVKDWFEEKGIKYEYLTGETKNREERVKRFNSDESIPVFLISLKAGGTGLNLTGADYVIHYDPWWNPAVEDQATDRAHRIGQTKKVFVYRLITKNTVEEKIMKLKERKRDLVDSIISVDRSIEKSLTFEDLKDILSPF
ncbi:MAG: translation initiation factor IF-2 N-terminal domain-containing protein [bacterium]